MKCTAQQLTGNIASTVLGFTSETYRITGVYLLIEADYPKSDLSPLFSELYIDNNGKRVLFDVPTYYTESNTGLGDIPENSLGSILEKSPSLKPTDIQYPIFYQTMLISGTIPPAESNSSDLSYLWWIVLGVFFLLGSLFVILYHYQSRRVRRHNRIDINLVRRNSLPVLSESDLEKIPCLTYDNAVNSTNSDSEYQKNSTSKPQNTLILSSSASPHDAVVSCSICLEGFKAKEEVRRLPKCSHIFHKDCVDSWLLEQSCCCPNCRYDMRIALGIEPGGDEEQGEEISSEMERLEESDSRGSVIVVHV
ncbi:hypothetical protein HK098_002774 [Nowakowskiella sp. JEL0407]|nr:hypothetical protein HK098_002774 [Nowakowskiella sp. JEL0407]